MLYGVAWAPFALIGLYELIGPDICFEHRIKTIHYEFHYSLLLVNIDVYEIVGVNYDVLLELNVNV